MRLASERFCCVALGGSWALAKDAPSTVWGLHMTCERNLFLLTAEGISEGLFRITCEAGSTGAGPGGFVKVYTT